MLPLQRRIVTMPRATSSKFSRIHQQVRPYAKHEKDKGEKNSEGGGANGTLNPLFNTEKFGQHILKNPAIAQTYDNVSSKSYITYAILE